jgi:hypothetical protein
MAGKFLPKKQLTLLQCRARTPALRYFPEVDERWGFGDLITQHLADSRRGKNTQLPLADLVRQSVYSRIAGYEDVNDGVLARGANGRLRDPWKHLAVPTRP